MASRRVKATAGIKRRKTRDRESKGIKSIEVGYRVLLAVQRGPGSVQLSEIAKRAQLGSGAVHNYLASLVRTGLVEQEGRGLYRLGPSAFALSLTSFTQLNGFDVLKNEARTLYDLTGQSTAVSVWSQGGPVSVFTQRADNLGAVEFRSGLIPMLRSAVGMVFAAYLPASMTSELIADELSGTTRRLGATDVIEKARKAVLPKGYAYFARSEESYYVLAAPVWTQDGRIAFVLSLLSRDPKTDPSVDRSSLVHLIECVRRASLFLSGTAASGPRSEFSQPSNFRPVVASSGG
jgi:DNA-binding IclR family transcriptional regulator